MRTLVVSALLASSTAGCTVLDAGPDEPRACTEVFATLTVHVVDGTGAPLEGLRSSATNTRTGVVLAASEAEEPFGAGLYVVADDGDRRDLREPGDPVHFRAEGGGRVAAADFVVGHDGCHVEKVSGPDSIVAQ